MVLKPRPLGRGVLVAVLAIAATTGAIYAVREIAPVASTGVLYLLAVLLVSSYWGIGLGLAVAVGSALAWNFFHIPPVHRFTIADAENWVALGVFVAAAAFASALAAVGAGPRAGGRAAARRGGPAGGAGRRCCSGRPASTRPAPRWPAGSAGRSSSSRPRSSCERVGGDERRLDIPLAAGDGAGRHAARAARHAGRRPGDAAGGSAPSLAALLATARRREQLEAELVEAEALRKGDVVKTALLRAISHDLRSPLTAIVTAAEGLGGRRLRGAGGGHPLGVRAPVPARRRPARPLPARDRRCARGWTGARSRR